MTAEAPQLHLPYIVILEEDVTHFIWAKMAAKKIFGDDLVDPASQFAEVFSIEGIKHVLDWAFTNPYGMLLFILDFNLPDGDSADVFWEIAERAEQSTKRVATVIRTSNEANPKRKGIPEQYVVLKNDTSVRDTLIKDLRAIFYPAAV